MPDFSRYAFFTFEIPANYYKKAILWSDFYQWHLVLNRLWKNEPDESDRYERIFQLKRNEKPGTIQGITTRIHKDWVKKSLRRPSWKSQLFNNEWKRLKLLVLH